MDRLIELIIPSLSETILMLAVSTFFTVIIGGILGIILVVTSNGHIMKNYYIHKSLAYVINITRSIPFIILMIFIIPFTRLITGTSIGTAAAIVPLVIASVPFFARVIESSMLEVDSGVIEAALSMGASNLQIIFKVIIPEALSSIVLGITITVINILGYSAMAGAVGGGGLGYLAIGYGYQRFQTDVMLATVLILIILVQVIQLSGNFAAEKLKHN